MWLNLPLTTILTSLTIWILLAINGLIHIDITACDWSFKIIVVSRCCGEDIKTKQYPHHKTNQLMRTYN